MGEVKEGKKRMLWSVGHDWATAFVRMIEPYCERVEIAGSIRRKKEMVGDVEIVCIPRYEMKRKDLFDTEAVNLLAEFLEGLAVDGVIEPRKQDRETKTGIRPNIAWFGKGEPRYLALYWGDVPVDVFMVNQDRRQWWGYIYWLRTGPGEANRAMVTQKSKRGLCPDHVFMRDGKVYQHGRPFPVPDEETMFDVLEMVYVEPEERSIEAYRKARHQWWRLPY